MTTVRLDSTVPTTTDADGNFEINDVVVGECTIAVTGDGCHTGAHGVTVEAEDTGDLSTLSLVAADTADKEDEPDNTMIYMVIAVAALAGFLFMREKQRCRNRGFAPNHPFSYFSRMHMPALRKVVAVPAKQLIIG